MNLSNVVIYTRDIKRAQDFFVEYFGAQAGEIINDTQMNDGGKAGFVSLPEGGEILFMMRGGLTDGSAYPLHTGISSLTLATGSQEKLREITMRIYKDGYTVRNMPRSTYYGRMESVVLDFDGNLITLTV